MRKLGALIVALGLAGVACGSGSGSNAEFGASVNNSTESQPDGASGSGANDAPVSDDADASEDPASNQETSTGEDAATLPDHLFPDVDVVEIATGEPLNLADELAGGDRPILLWFWAPH